MRTFEGGIAESDLVFTFNRLSMRSQEHVIDLVESFREVVAQDRKRGFALIREAVAICVSGWSSDKPLSDIDTELDLKQMTQLVNVALSGNALSEDERKKSE